MRGLALVIYPVKFHSPEHLNLFVFVNPSPRLQRWARLTDQGSMSMPSLGGYVEFGPIQFLGANAPLELAPCPTELPPNDKKVSE